MIIYVEPIHTFNIASHGGPLKLVTSPLLHLARKVTHVIRVVGLILPNVYVIQSLIHDVIGRYPREKLITSSNTTSLFLYHCNRCVTFNDTPIVCIPVSSSFKILNISLQHSFKL